MPERRLAGALLLAAFLLVYPALGQQDQGVITGTIADATGAVIPGASIAIREVNTNITVQVESNASGVYVSGPLRIGTYEISVETAGFKRYLRSGVEIHAGDRIGIDFALEVGNVIEVIEVTDSTPLLQTESAALDYTVQRKQIEQLPISGRNYQSLALLAAGVAPEIGGRDRGPLGDSAIGGGFVSHGQPALQNNFLIDGVDNNSTVMGLQDRKAQAIIPSLDAVQEFKVQTSNYNAEYGRNAGAVVNVTIRGGTNEFHGSAYNFLRNDFFDARDAFGRVDRTGDGKADPEVLRQNQFGATIGGPVIKNRTFFFFSYEGWRVRRSNSDLVVVPTALERAGDFSQTTGLAQLRDPEMGGTFANKTIPGSRFDPVMAGLLPLYPQPNYSDGTRNNFVAGPPLRTDRDQYDMRFDHRFSDADTAFFRFSRFNFENLNGAPLPGLARGGVGNDRALDDNGGEHLTGSWTHTFSPTLINEVRIGYKNLLVDKRQEVDTLQDELNQQFGIRGIPRNETIRGLPRFGFAGNIGHIGLGGSNNLPNWKISRTTQFIDNLTYVVGNHSFKFGVDMRYDQSDIDGSQAAPGAFVFNGRYTGIGLGDGILGWADQASLGTPVFGEMRFWSWMGYAQDDWKVKRNLTLSFGMRYELTTPWYELNDRMNKPLFDAGPDFGRIIRAGELGGGYGSRGLANLDRNNFAPRVGIAWQPSDKWSIRAGGGIFYGGQMGLGADARMISNFPFVASATARGTNAAPALLLRNGFPSGFLGDLDAPVTNVSQVPNNSNLRHFSTDHAIPQTHQWNLSVQRELGKDLALTTAYVGSGTQSISMAYNINGPAPGNPNTEAARRPFFSNLNAITYRSPAAHSTYHGLEATLTKRMAKGRQFTAAYTWSHGISNTAELFVSGDNGAPQDITCFSCEKGSTSNDVRQRFVTNYLVELPFGRGKAMFNQGGVMGAVLGGWQLTGIMAIQTGQYYNVSLPNAAARLGTNAVGDWRPNVIGDHRVANPNPDRWYNPAAFAQAVGPDGQPAFGNLGRNSMQEAGIFNWDVGLAKTFRVTERINTQFRWEVFNVTNHPSYGTPNTNVLNPDAGLIRSTNTLPRQMQLGLRVTF